MNYHDFAVDLVRRAGALVKEAHSQTLHVSYKEGDPRNPVTALDIEINDFLIREIKKEYPEHRIYSEEGNADQTFLMQGYEWALDPIDGTSNFSHHIPHFAVCVALFHEGVPIAGAVYNPITDELFSFDGHKAFLNGKPIAVSPITEPKDAQSIVIVGHHAPLWDWGAALYRSFLEYVNKNKSFGSAALDLAYLAAGRADVVVYGTFSMPDGSVGVALVRAAGGEVYDLSTMAPLTFESGRRTIVATANPELFAKLQPLLHVELIHS